MVNPYDLTDSRQLALIQGYVVDVKDKGDVNMLLFRKDTTKGDGGLISVAAWAAGEGQDTPDMKKMTDGLKGAFVACVHCSQERKGRQAVYELRLEVPDQTAEGKGVVSNRRQAVISLPPFVKGELYGNDKKFVSMLFGRRSSARGNQSSLQRSVCEGVSQV